jgi:tRNA pseudouridine synthase 10
MKSQGKKRSKSLANEILESYRLCNWCLRRQLPKRMANVKKKYKADQLQRSLRNTYIQSSSNQCYICRGLTSSINSVSEQVLKALDGYEFGTFLVGASLPSDMMDREDKLRACFKLKGGESIKSEITQVIGRFISSKIGKKVSYRRPDLTVIVNFATGSISINTKPAYLFGRYVKKVRNLPQKQPKCANCGGSGCGECKGTGLASTQSVEGILASKIISYSQARQVRFTWVGSEDADSLVLGNGRPFYAEVFDPKIRSLNPNEPIFRRERQGIFLKEIQTVEAKPARIPDFTVTILARVRFERLVNQSDLEKLERELTNTTVQSLSRRKGKVLEKRIYSLKVRTLKEGKGELRIECDGGLSIKKFVTGENGDVIPNISQTLKIPISLDEKRPFDILKVRFR